MGDEKDVEKSYSNKEVVAKFATLGRRSGKGDNL